jgi:hypothetical protein
MVTMRCNATPATVSRQYENNVTEATASNDINLPEDILASVYEADSYYTHISSEHLDIHHEVDKMTLTDDKAVSSNRDEECVMCVPDSAMTGNFKTQDGTSFSSLSLVYVSAMVDTDENIDLGVKDEDKKNIVKILSGNNSIVMPTVTKNTSSKTTVNFKKSVKRVQSRELFTAQESTRNLSIKLSMEGTEKSIISTETSADIQLTQSNAQNAEIKTSRGYRISYPSEQYLNRSQSPPSSKTDSIANETEYKHQDNEYGLSLAFKKKQAQDNAISYNKTVVKDCNPEHNLITYHSETVKLRDSVIRPAMLQHPSRTFEPILEFPDVPEGGKFHIQELDLSEGLFVLSYISSFLSWMQPYEFPVGKFTVEC